MAQQSTTQQLYHMRDQQYLENVHQIVTDETGWETHSKSQNDIVLQYKHCDINGVPISRATTHIQTSPEHLFLGLKKNVKMICDLIRDCEFKSVVKYNDCKRVVTVVISMAKTDSKFANSRSYVFQETFALSDGNGTIFTHAINDNFINNTFKKLKNRKLIVSLRSVDNIAFDDESEQTIRATFFRTGLVVQSVSNSDYKMTFVIEYDIGGGSFVRPRGNSPSVCCEWSYRLCNTLKHKLEFAEMSFSILNTSKLKAKVEEKENDKMHNHRGLENILLDLKDEIKTFKEHYNESKVQEIYNKSAAELLQKESEINTNIRKASINIENIILSSKSFCKIRSK